MEDQRKFEDRNFEENHSRKFGRAIDFLLNNTSEEHRKNVLMLRDAVDSVTEERDIQSWVKSDIAKMIADYSGRGMSAEALLPYVFTYFQGTFRILTLIRADEEELPEE